MSRIAITGGTGFVGRHVAARLIATGHEVVLVARGVDRRVPVGREPRIRLVEASVTDPSVLALAFQGCDAIVHCAGINREIGSQTYEAIHVAGTRAVVDAARSAGVGRLVMLSFLRARPGGPSSYHRSKWVAEEVVRGSGLQYTILKAGVIHGRGDPRLTDRTIAVLGPEELTLGAAVRRVAAATGRRPIFVRLPVQAHRLLAIALEALMTIPLIARAQVEILAEGIAEPLPFADEPPADLAPTTPFSEEVIRAGLPPAGGFGRVDLRCCAKPI